MIRNDKGWGMKKITMKERAKDEAVLSWRLTTQKQKRSVRGIKRKERVVIWLPREKKAVLQERNSSWC